MDEIDFYTNVIIEAARYDPVLRRALERLPPPPVHHHCSCCGRIIPQGTPEPIGLARQWFRAITDTAILRRGLSYVARSVYRFLGRSSLATSRKKRLVCMFWLTFACVEDLVRETTAATSILASSSSETTVIPSRNKPPTGRQPTSKPRQSRSRAVKYAESGKLVEPVAVVDRVEAIKPKEAIKLAEPVQPAKREESPELSKPTKPEAITPQRGQKFSEEVPAKHTRQVLQSTYVEQKYWGSSIEAPTKPRVKAKARHRDENTTLPPSPPQEITARASLAPNEPEGIAVSSASKETLSRLFTSDPKQKRQVHFDDIVAALEDAGLTAKRGGKCAGSAVTFKDRGGKGSISFHCPHPDPRIEFHKLRTWGTRLQNKFGWELETFVDRVG